jgi:site-specific DNA-methyltransferase (adenine-specific)
MIKFIEKCKSVKSIHTVGDCTLLRGDSIKIMRELIHRGFRAKCVASDPPYLLTSGGGTNQPMAGVFSKDQYDNGGHLVPCDIDWNDFMPLFYEIMTRGHAYVMANNRNVQPMLNAAEKAGFGFHNLLVWDKCTATPNRWYMKNCEFTGLFYKGKAQQINDCGAKACIRYQHTDVSDHPTEKPVSLMRYYIENSTDKGDIVIDPFAGSGTTGVACMQSGRKFLGIEMDESFYNTACKRLTAQNQNLQANLL